MIHKIKKVINIIQEEGLGEALSTVNNHLRYLDSPFTIVPGWIVRPAICDIIWYRYKFDLDYEQALDLAIDGERNIIVDLLNNISTDDVFYDVGAHNGTYSLKVAPQLNSKKNIVAFEPGQQVHELKETARRYGYDMTIVEKGVGNEEKGNFYRHVNNGQVSITTDRDKITEEIDVITSEQIKDFNVPKPSVVKIDVNGWDLDTLRALRPLLEGDKCRLLYIEIEPPSIDTSHRHPKIYDLTSEDLRRYFNEKWSFDEIVILLTESGFKIEYVMDHTNDLFIKASK